MLRLKQRQLYALRRLKKAAWLFGQEFIYIDWEDCAKALEERERELDRERQLQELREGFSKIAADLEACVAAKRDYQEETLAASRPSVAKTASCGRARCPYRIDARRPHSPGRPRGPPARSVTLAEHDGTGILMRKKTPLSIGLVLIIVLALAVIAVIVATERRDAAPAAEVQ